MLLDNNTEKVIDLIDMFDNLFSNIISAYDFMLILEQGLKLRRKGAFVRLQIASVRK